jgi:3-hydroxymyristoyl/3-hydroxydecanoyl-(acyl carrier protein) dehydratase
MQINSNPMLKNPFYTVTERQLAGTEWRCRVSLNAAHPLYCAHFPGHPVTPGACIMQMAKDIACLCYARPFFMGEVRNVKFLKVIDPTEQTEISVHLVPGSVDEAGRDVVSVSFRSDAAVFSSMILALTPVAGALQERINRLRLCVIIPVYNNERTVAEVLERVFQYTHSVIVINDGSTDGTASILQGFAQKADIIHCPANRGKGHALRHGFRRARKLGYEAAVTIDADGQHNPDDLETVVTMAEIYPGTLLAGQRMTEGVMPAGNSFANRFSNFWFTVQTGRLLPDTQNGFRLYPLAAMKGMYPLTCRYEAETELLVRAAWRNIPVRPVEVHVFYAPLQERVSHFRPGMDFFRISLLNTVLTILAVCYGYPVMMFRKWFFPHNRSR